MNAGMHGMASGQGGAVRKVVGHILPTTNDLSNGYSSAIALAAGMSKSMDSPGLTAGVRTRLLSVSGRGAVRGAAMGLSGFTATITYELWVDGVLFKKFENQSMGSGQGITLAGMGSGNNTYPTFCPDYIPFDSGCEIWMTSGTTVTAGSGLLRTAHWVDIHQ